MSLRIRMQTLSPWPTPSRSNPPAIRAARSVTSACVRRRWPLIMPRKREWVGICFFDLNPAAGNSSRHSHIRKARRALFDVGADGFGLVRTAQQPLLLDGFGEQCGAGIDRQLAQHALGGADRIGAFSRDFSRDFKSRRPRIVADPRREPVTQCLLRRE